MTHWKDIRTCAEASQAFPHLIGKLFAALDLARPDMAEVGAAWESGHAADACQALLRHYQTATGRRLNDEQCSLPNLDPAVGVEADELLEDIFHGNVDKSRLSRDQVGHLDWTCRGPNDDRQFVNHINRHYFLMRLMQAYQATGRDEYVRCLDAHWLDWLTAADGDPAPAGYGRGLLEAAIRMRIWPQVFFGLAAHSAFQPATRLLMLAALPPHANYLLDTLQRRHNFAASQMNGLGTLGVAFPEFRQAEQWWHFARQVMAEEIEHQVYPDGAQVELAFNYHNAALGQFEELMHTAEKLGRTLDGVYRRRLELMWNYVSQVLRPDGTGPQNGDSKLSDQSQRLLLAAKRFGREDWRYVATLGREGTRPADPPSRFLPWAGQLVSRDGWGADAQWSFFDVGPYGVTTHGHPDKLHLSITVDRHLLVDPGLFAYQGTIAQKFRNAYARQTRGHNAILIDGRGQAKGALDTQSPLGKDHYAITPDYDWAVGEMDEFDELSGQAAHRRAVYYRRGEYWLVVDRIRTDRPRTIQPLWHFHPQVTVTADGDQLVSTDQMAANLRLVPAGGQAWSLSLKRGQEEPELMGWYCPKYGKAIPTTVAVYEAGIDQGATTCAWLIVPARGQVPPAELELVRSENDYADLWVRIQDGTWEIRVKL